MKKSLLLFVVLMFVGLYMQSQTWITQNVNPVDSPYNLWYLSVVDETTVYSVGHDFSQTPDRGNYLSWTSNGGANWSSVALDTAYFPTSIQALNANKLLLSINYIDTVNFNAQLLESTDGGVSWNANTALPFDTTSYILFAYFFNPNTGVAFGDVHNGAFEVYYTNNGGLSWNAATVPPALNGEFGLDNHYCVQGNNIWVPTTEGRIFHSANNGVSWSVSEVGNFSFPTVSRAAFYNDQEGIVVSYNFNTGQIGNLYKTNDGGQTWTVQTFSGNIFQSFFGGLFVLPGSNVVFSSGASQSLFGSSYSIDGGLSWQNIDNSNGYGGIDGKGWNSLWTGQFSFALGVGGGAKWDGTALNIRQIEANTEFSIVPNPSNGKFVVELGNENLSDIIVSVSDLTGKKVFQREYKQSSGSFRQTIDLKNLLSGVYVVQVSSGTKHGCKRLVIE